MENLKCQCGKIVCQIYGQIIIIKCRHCKRFVVIDLNNFNDQKSLRQMVRFK